MLRLSQFVVLVVGVSTLSLAAQTPVSLATPGLTKPVLVHSSGPSYVPEPHGLLWLTTTKVLVGYTVGTDGHTYDIHILKSKGRDYDTLAMAAIARYRYAPAIKDGVPVAVTMKHHVAFQHVNNYDPGPFPPMHSLQ